MLGGQRRPYFREEIIIMMIFLNDGRQDGRPMMPTAAWDRRSAVIMIMI
jgi:hypothetical protein